MLLRRAICGLSFSLINFNFRCHRYDFNCLKLIPLSDKKKRIRSRSEDVHIGIA